MAAESVTGNDGGSPPSGHVLAGRGDTGTEQHVRHRIEV